MRPVGAVVEEDPVRPERREEQPAETTEWWAPNTHTDRFHVRARTP